MEEKISVEKITDGLKYSINIFNGVPIIGRAKMQEYAAAVGNIEYVLTLLSEKKLNIVEEKDGME